MASELNLIFQYLRVQVDRLGLERLIEIFEGLGCAGQYDQLLIATSVQPPMPLPLLLSI